MSRVRGDRPGQRAAGQVAGLGGDPGVQHRDGGVHQVRHARRTASSNAVSVPTRSACVAAVRRAGLQDGVARSARRRSRPARGCWTGSASRPPTRTKPPSVPAVTVGVGHGQAGAQRPDPALQLAGRGGGERPHRADDPDVELAPRPRRPGRAAGRGRPPAPAGRPRAPGRWPAGVRPTATCGRGSLGLVVGGLHRRRRSRRAAEDAGLQLAGGVGLHGSLRGSGAGGATHGRCGPRTISVDRRACAAPPGAVAAVPSRPLPGPPRGAVRGREENRTGVVAPGVVRPGRRSQACVRAARDPALTGLRGTGTVGCCAQRAWACSRSRCAWVTFPVARDHLPVIAAGGWRRRVARGNGVRSDFIGRPREGRHARPRGSDGASAAGSGKVLQQDRHPARPDRATQSSSTTQRR